MSEENLSKMVDMQMQTIGGMINREISNNVFGEMVYGKEWLENKYKNPKYFFDDKTKEDCWRTDEPPVNKKIELLCVLFDDNEHRELKEYDWSSTGTNRCLITGYWNGSEFIGYYPHSSGDPWYCVVAWKEIDCGEKFYSHCLGEVKPR